MRIYYSTPLATIEGIKPETVSALKLSRGWEVMGDVVSFKGESGSFDKLGIDGVDIGTDQADILEMAWREYLETPDPMNDQITEHLILSEADGVTKALAQLGLTTMRELFMLTHSPRLQTQGLYDPGERAHIVKYFKEVAAEWRRPTENGMAAFTDDIMEKLKPPMVAGAEDDVVDGSFTIAGEDGGPVESNAELKGLRQDHEFTIRIKEHRKEAKELRRAFENKLELAKEAKRKWNEARDTLDDMIDEYTTGQKRLDLKADEAPVKAKGKKKKGEKPEGDEAVVKPAKVSVGNTGSWRELPVDSIINDRVILTKLKNSGITTAGHAHDWEQGKFEGSPPVKLKLDNLVRAKQSIAEFVSTHNVA